VRFISSNDVTERASKFDLYLFKLLHVLTFKKTKWIPPQIGEIEKNIKQKNNRVVY